MPRTGRVILPEYPHHIVQRGHNRQAFFAEPADFRRYLGTLEEFKDVFGVRVYAFCLMTNHVHLLVAPETASSLGLLMKRLAGRQTQFEPKGSDSIENNQKTKTMGTDLFNYDNTLIRLTNQPCQCRERINAENN